MFELLPNIVCKPDVFEMDSVRIQRKSSEDRVLDRYGLLINFLQHEMLIAALFRHDRIPRDVLELRLPSLAGCVQQTNAVAGNDRYLMVIEKQNRARVGKHGWNIRRDESFTFHGADDERITFAHSDNFLRIVDRDACESK